MLSLWLYRRLTSDVLVVFKREEPASALEVLELAPLVVDADGRASRMAVEAYAPEGVLIGGSGANRDVSGFALIEPAAGLADDEAPAV